MLYKCLMASLTSKAKNKVLIILSNQYKSAESKMSSGVALLKIKLDLLLRGRQ
jgi:hypothetical protein